MQTNSIVTDGNTRDLLSDIYRVQVRNEEKITERDRVYCQRQQDELYKSLTQIEHWYKVFTEDAEKYRESHRISYEPNGEIKTRPHHRSYEEELQDYADMEFYPFESIKELTKLNYRAHETFANRIVRYFNQTYNVSVPLPDIDNKTLPIGSRPVYGTYVGLVIEHLGGRGFRETAEDELLKRFLQAVRPSRWSKVKPELKGDKISFPDVIMYDSFYYDNYKQNHLHYNYRSELEHFCEGIAFGADDTLCGGIGIIIHFNPDQIDTSDWYDLNTTHAEQMKFFRNGRIDVKFKDKEMADLCYKKLKLDGITLDENQ